MFLPDDSSVDILFRLLCYVSPGPSKVSGNLPTRIFTGCLISMDKSLTFEQGPIRPPSEAGSLLIRVTRNCPWNRCVFCGTYKNKKFSRRSVEEVKADIDSARSIHDEILNYSLENGYGGELTHGVLRHVLENNSLPDSYRSVAYWLASGGETVFLQDANSIMLSTDSLVEILNHIRFRFPQVTRVTSYARASSLTSKSVDDFMRLRECGLSRLHVGMESGSDKVLEMIQKGAKAQHLIDGGRNAVAAGISVCLYVMPGIGGVALSNDHTRESARVINAINPKYVRFRSLYIRRSSELTDMEIRGEFQAPDEDSMVREIRDIIERLEGINTTIVSDHILNLLEEVNGKLPEEKEKILSVIDRYLNMPEDDRLLFQLGRRGGALSDLDEMNDPAVKSKLLSAKLHIEREMPGGVTEYIQAIKKRFV